MKVLVLGARGRTGSAVVQQALAAGHDVSALVRRAGDYQAPTGVTVSEGDATDAESVAAAVAGQDAVIDTVGGTTPYRSGLTLERDVATAVVTAMQRHGVRRLLVTSAIGVGDSITHGDVVLRVLVKTFLRGSTQDKAAMERVVEASDLDWTVVRPAVLDDGPATGSVRTFTTATGGTAHKISRADLATWLVTQLDATEHVRRTVTVASR